MKVLVGAFNQEKALVGAFSVIVKTDGSVHSTNLNLVQGAQCPVTRLQSISRTGESEDTCAGLYPELMLQEDGSVYSFSLIKSPNLDWSVYCFKECSSNIANFLQHKILTEGYYTYF